MTDLSITAPQPSQTVPTRVILKRKRPVEVQPVEVEPVVIQPVEVM